MNEERTREQRIEDALRNAIIVMANNARRLADNGSTHHELDEMLSQAKAALNA